MKDLELLQTAKKKTVTFTVDTINPPVSKKTVTFTADTKNPPVSEKCSSCGHRNIIPRIREMDLCMECFKLTCNYCITSMSICVECEYELLETDTPKGISDSGDYPEYDDLYQN
uniref:Uncharacterized protein n=1 Tax=Marseillevirus LCMAC202 TaxID=2506606 RepID=A0A481YXU8_9VIRU|nr:MAG: hypothetical protein LCMAC202_01660 [Marseillevirus LCMAC202]